MLKIVSRPSSVLDLTLLAVPCRPPTFFADNSQLTLP